MSENTSTDLVYAIACTSDQSVCFAARASGLYRSLDGGHTWQPAYGSLSLNEPLPTIAVAVSPDFAADRTVIAGVSGGVLYSTDGGETWQAVTLGSPPPVVSSLVISPNFVEDGIVLAGTMEDGVFRSADRGRRWAAWNFGLLDLNVLCLAISPDFATDETLFAGVDTGIFRSTNGGRAWREVELPFGYDPVISLKLSPRYTQDGMLFAGTESQGLWCSADRGVTWTRLGADVFAGPVNAIVLAPDFESSAALLVMAGDTLHVSRDGGNSWDKNLLTIPGMTAVAAPQGLDAPLLIGLENGTVVVAALDKGH